MYENIKTIGKSKRNFFIYLYNSKNILYLYPMVNSFEDVIFGAQNHISHKKKENYNKDRLFIYTEK